MGAGTRLSCAIRCFFSLLFSGVIPSDVLARCGPAAPAEPASPASPPPPVPEDTPDRAIQLLALLQRDGRLVDFLQEDIAAYADAQVGAAVRDVHATARATLSRYVTMEPVLTEAEGDHVVVPRVDPLQVKVVGTVGSTGALRGVVRHRGWRVTGTALPPLPAPGGRAIVAPAEVEAAER